MSLCTRCDQKETRVFCGACLTTGYCSKRCQYIDAQYGGHNCSLEPKDPQDPNEDMLPYVFRKLPEKERVYLAHQAPPHLVAFGSANHPFVVAVSDSCDLMQARLYDGVFAFIGEESRDEIHPARGRRRPMHHFLGARQLRLTESLVEELGRAMAELHETTDANGFVVVRAHEYRANYDPKGMVTLIAPDKPEYALYIRYDHDRARAIPKNRDDPEILQHLGFLMGMSPYIPHAEQGALFDAFIKGYRARAGNARTDALVNVMKTFLS